MLTQAAVTEALKTVKYPGYSRDIVSFGLVKEVAVTAGIVSVGIQLTGGSPEIANRLKTECEIALKSLPGAGQVIVQVSHPGGPGGVPAGRESVGQPEPGARRETRGGGGQRQRRRGQIHGVGESGLCAGASGRRGSVCWIVISTGRAFR